MTDQPMTVPGIMIFFGFLIGASDPVRKLSGVITGLNIGIVGAQGLYPLLDMPSKLAEAVHPREVPSPHQEIRLENVSFSYDGIDTVLKDVNVAIRFGERVAIVGPNGFRLSGGQRQRIALARAFLRNAEILVLDEATSQIDVDSERLIHAALSAYVENRTVIMITHRASTLALADAIIEVDHGIVTKRPARQQQAA